jgi:cleavage and polyadenylation specificity factor subunit 6/7
MFLAFMIIRWLLLSCEQVGAPPPEHRPEGPPPKRETASEEIMGRNRTVSSSATARSVPDAAAGKLYILQLVTIS